MDRIEKIKMFAENRDNEEKRVAEAHAQAIATFLEKVAELKPRIEELIKLGNCMLENGIPLYTPCKHEGYSTGNFHADGVNHQFGFVFDGYKDFYPTGVKSVGIDFYDKEEIYTDGIVTHIGDSTAKNVYWFPKRAERFLQDFEVFEKAVFDYIDNLNKE